MTTTSAYAVYDVSYGLRTPYITTTEYQNAPQALDLMNLLAGGNPSAQLIALQESINRASSWIDQFTQGAWGTLCCTSQNENARTWGTYRNTLSLHCKYWPIVEVSAFSYSACPGGLSSNGQSASITPSGNITVYPTFFEVATQGTINWSPYSPGGIVCRHEYDTTWTYVAGWVNTTLAASVSAGATSVMPSSVVGIYPNSLMTLYDLPNDEPIIVADTYTPGSSVVPLVSELQYNHYSTATIANIPPVIKQAAIWATSAFIKQRGSGALEVTDMGAAVRQASGAPQNSGSDMQQAMMLLRAVMQSYVGY